MGSNNGVAGSYATVFGATNAVGADFGTAFGLGTVANGFGQFVIGQYNVSQGAGSYPNSPATADGANDDLFIIGKGTGPSSSSRSNAFKVQRNKNATIYGHAQVANNLNFNGQATSNGQAVVSLATLGDPTVSLGSHNSQSSIGDITIGNHAQTLYSSGGIAVGNNVQSFGGYAIGYGAQASSHSSVIGSNVVGGVDTVAIGSSVRAGDYNTVAMGIGLDTYAVNAVVIGFYCNVADVNQAIGGTVIGYASSAMGNYSSAYGSQNMAMADFSSAFGNNAYAGSFGETVTGQYNIIDPTQNPTSFIETDEIFVVGNGKSLLTPSNALVVQKNSDVTVSGNFAAQGVGLVRPTGDVSMGDFQDGPTPTQLPDPAAP